MRKKGACVEVGVGVIFPLLLRVKVREGICRAIFWLCAG